MHRLDHAYADPYPKNLKTQKQNRTLKQQTNNLTYKHKLNKKTKFKHKRKTEKEEK